MLMKWIYYHWLGYVRVNLEGFFINRFLNLCKNENIDMCSLVSDNGTYIKFEVLKKDFKKIKHIAKKTKCRVKIEKKIGIPYFLNKYKKRKVFAVALSAVTFFIIFLSNFIWDIDVIGCEHMLEKDIVDILNKKGISIGKSKHNINFEKIENEIKIENPKIAWIGIDIEGTRISAQVKEAIERIKRHENH